MTQELWQVIMLKCKTQNSKKFPQRNSKYQNIIFFNNFNLTVKYKKPSTVLQNVYFYQYAFIQKKQDTEYMLL